MGDLYGVATAVFFGAYVLAVRAARARHGAAALMFVSTAITSACLFVIAFAFEPRILPQSLQGARRAARARVMSQVGGQGLVAVALGTLPATFSSLVIFLEAIAAATFGWLLLDEPLGLAQLLGGVLILFGIWIARPRAGDLVAVHDAARVPRRPVQHGGRRRALRDMPAASSARRRRQRPADPARGRQGRGLDDRGRRAALSRRGGISAGAPRRHRGRAPRLWPPDARRCR
jgi:hypothetical protein